jgi:hypothetical protein
LNSVLLPRLASPATRPGRRSWSSWPRRASCRQQSASSPHRRRTGPLPAVGGRSVHSRSSGSPYPVGRDHWRRSAAAGGEPLRNLLDSTVPVTDRRREVVDGHPSHPVPRAGRGHGKTRTRASSPAGCTLARYVQNAASVLIVPHGTACPYRVSVFTLLRRGLRRGPGHRGRLQRAHPGHPRGGPGAGR